jgi:sphingolipid delta-4 desaturase
MGGVVTKQEFTRVGTDEPHASRRKAILKAHPEISTLFGPDIRLLWCVLALAAIQVGVACFVAPHVAYTWKWWALAWALGGTVTHALSLANHELSHNLCFDTPILNELLGFVSNFAQGIPSAVTFKKYHLEHHYYQGADNIDTDIPSDWEAKYVTDSFRKLIWALLQPLAYSLRPVLLFPKPVKPMEILNMIATFAFNYWLFRTFGMPVVLFNVASTLLGMGLHPVAGHFISEHYQFHQDQETYSYYGPLNWFCFNVGYHNEHHDFPKISGFRLPQVKAMAPEFYQDLYVHRSWISVIYDYITRPDLGPYSRVKRTKGAKQE